MGVCSSTESAGAPPTPVSERQQPQTPRSGPASGRRPSSGCVGEIACVVSDFAAEAAEELAVRRGEFVTISAGPTREGWCAVSVERALSGSRQRTLRHKDRMGGDPFDPYLL